MMSAEPVSPAAELPPMSARAGDARVRRDQVLAVSIGHSLSDVDALRGRT